MELTLNITIWITIGITIQPPPLLEVICPADCSGQGTCNEGKEEKEHKNIFGLIQIIIMCLATKEYTQY